MNILVGIKDLDSELQIQGNLVPTLKFAPIFLKFGTQDTSDDMLIIITLR